MSRMPIALAMLIITVGLGPAPAAAEAKTPSVDELRAAVAALEKEPLTAQARGHLRTIIIFAEESEDVLVRIDPGLLTFVDAEKSAPHTSLLLGAFVAGNVLSQLDRQVNEDDTYAGLLMVFKVYHRIREAQPNYRVEEVEQLEAMEKEGTLKDHLDQRRERTQDD